LFLQAITRKELFHARNMSANFIPTMVSTMEVLVKTDDGAGGVTGYKDVCGEIGLLDAVATVGPVSGDVAEPLALVLAAGPPADIGVAQGLVDTGKNLVVSALLPQARVLEDVAEGLHHDAGGGDGH